MTPAVRPSDGPHLPPPADPLAWRTVPALLSGVMVTAFFAVVLLLCPPRLRSRSLTDAVLTSWGRTLLRLAGTKVEVTGREHMADGVAYVVVSNHESNLDAIVHLGALGRLGHSLRILTKQELFTVPLLGPALRAVGMVAVDRGNADRQAINSASARSLADGVSVLVFPEGTTSDGDLLPFKSGAFNIAVANGAPVLPVTLVGTRERWPSGRPRIFGGRVVIHIAAPIPTDGLTGEDIPALLRRTREVIAAHRRGEPAQRVTQSAGRPTLSTGEPSPDPGVRSVAG